MHECVLYVWVGELTYIGMFRGWRSVSGHLPQSRLHVILLIYCACVYYLFVCVHTHVLCTPEGSEDNWQVLVFSFYNVSFRDWTQFLYLGESSFIHWVIFLALHIFFLRQGLSLNLTLAVFFPSPLVGMGLQATCLTTWEPVFQFFSTLPKYNLQTMWYNVSLSMKT